MGSLSADWAFTIRPYVAVLAIAADERNPLVFLLTTEEHAAGGFEMTLEADAGITATDGAAIRQRQAKYAVPSEAP